MKKRISFNSDDYFKAATEAAVIVGKCVGGVDTQTLSAVASVLGSYSLALWSILERGEKE